MGLRFIIGYEQGTENLGDAHELAALFCSTTGIVFGRTFHSVGNLGALKVGQRFLDWCEREKGLPRGDVRSLTTSETIVLQDEFIAILNVVAETGAAL